MIIGVYNDREEEVGRFVRNSEDGDPFVATLTFAVGTEVAYLRELRNNWHPPMRAQLWDGFQSRWLTPGDTIAFTLNGWTANVDDPLADMMTAARRHFDPDAVMTDDELFEHVASHFAGLMHKFHK